MGLDMVGQAMEEMMENGLGLCSKLDIWIQDATYIDFVQP
jgi:hypothetical protein